jgi:hypothetical protein
MLEELNMKYIVPWFLGVIVAVFVGLGVSSRTGVEANALESNDYFVELSDEYDGAVVYDTRTGVEYWRSDSPYSRGVLTMLYDADGKPLIYDGK